MIVLITTRGNGYTLASLAHGTFGVPTPKFRLTHYECVLRAWWLPRATYIFGDLERLAPWELRIAARLYRDMSAAGLRCLNDPARAMSRAELLIALNAARINGFTALRADERPRPARFPVFLRAEDDHSAPSAELFHDQDALDRALQGLRGAGTPLRGILVIEQAAERYTETLWAKWGTYRIGQRLIVEHLAVDDTWLVKIGDKLKMTEATIADERDAVLSNRFAHALAPAFDVAGIEFGRADHAVVGGRTVVYEINTNPYMAAPSKVPSSLVRADTNRIARTRIAEALGHIDTSRGGWVRIRSATRRPIRWWRPGFVTPRRP